MFENNHCVLGDPQELDSSPDENVWQRGQTDCLPFKSSNEPEFTEQEARLASEMRLLSKAKVVLPSRDLTEIRRGSFRSFPECLLCGRVVPGINTWQGCACQNQDLHPLAVVT